MRRLVVLLALFAFVSYADTNSVDLTEIENYLSSLDSKLSTIEGQFHAIPNTTVRAYITRIYNTLNTIQKYINLTSETDTIYTVIKAHLESCDTALSSIISNLVTIGSDVSNSAESLESVLVELERVDSWLYEIDTTLTSIANYASSLPRIEAHQQFLALIVSNINNIVSDVGVTVNLPSSFNVNVDNFPSVNFNPAWDWQLKYIHGTGEPSSETLVWQNTLDLTDFRSTRWRLFPDMHNDTTFASFVGMLYQGLDQGFESLSSSGVRSVLLLHSISNINAQIYHLLSGLSPNTNLVATTDEQTESTSALRQEKLTTDSVNSEISSLDYTPNIYQESLPNISSRPRLSGVVSSHDSLSETASFDIDVSGFFQTATDMGFTQFAHPSTTLSVDLRPVNEICIAVRQLFLMIFWMVTIALGAKLCLTVYGLYQTIWSSLMSSDSDIGGGQTVNAINYMRHILPQ